MCNKRMLTNPSKAAKTQECCPLAIKLSVMVLSRITIHFTGNWSDERQQRQSPENTMHSCPDRPSSAPVLVRIYIRILQRGKTESDLPKNSSNTFAPPLRKPISLFDEPTLTWTILERRSFLLTYFEVKSCTKITLLKIGEFTQICRRHPDLLTPSEFKFLSLTEIMPA